MNKNMRFMGYGGQFHQGMLGAAAPAGGGMAPGGGDGRGFGGFSPLGFPFFSPGYPVATGRQVCRKDEEASAREGRDVTVCEPAPYPQRASVPVQVVFPARTSSWL